MPDIYNFDRQELEHFFERMGEKPFRARQVIIWIYGKRMFDFKQMSDIRADLRTRLSEIFTDSGMSTVRIEQSKDGTVKILNGLSDGEQVESVLIPDGKRLTLCVSTQVGCAVGCRFCVTAKIGFRRNLTAGEITGQYRTARNVLKSLSREKKAESKGQTISNIVLMGMGEALHNYENTVKAVNNFTDRSMYAFARRKVTISTVGIVAGLEKLSETPHIGCVAISLGGSTDKQRKALIPVAKQNSLSKLVCFMKETPLPRRCFFTTAYVIIKDFNDSEEDALRLSRLLKGVRCKVNLIPYNENEYTEFATPSEETVERFGKILVERGFMVMKRKSRGSDIKAACGLLKADYEKQG